MYISQCNLKKMGKEGMKYESKLDLNQLCLVHSNLLTFVDKPLVAMAKETLLACFPCIFSVNLRNCKSRTYILHIFLQFVLVFN